MPADQHTDQAHTSTDSQSTPTPQETTVTAHSNETEASTAPTIRVWLIYKMNQIREWRQANKDNDRTVPLSTHKSMKRAFLSVMLLMGLAFGIIATLMDDRHRTREDEAYSIGVSVGRTNGFNEAIEQERDRISFEEEAEDASVYSGYYDTSTNEVTTSVFSTICTVDTDYDGFRLSLSTGKEIYVTNDMVADSGNGNPVPYTYIQELWKADGTLAGISDVSSATDPQGQSICSARNNRFNTTGMGGFNG